MRRFLLILAAALIAVAGFAGFIRAETEGLVDGNIEMYLYESGTGNQLGGNNHIQASLGDTISVDVYLRNPKRDRATGFETYFTVRHEYFDLVRQGLNEGGTIKPFIMGPYTDTFGEGEEPIKNNTHDDKTDHLDNRINGWQMDYVILSRAAQNGDRPYTSKQQGVLCTFKLVCIAPCDSATIALDRDAFNARSSKYFKSQTVDDFTFRSFNTIYISVSGVEIDPPLEDLFMEPATVDSTSLDLDDHIGLSSVPTSRLQWSAAGNDRIGVDIRNPGHEVVFTVPGDFHGYEDIEFTVRYSSLQSSDVMRVTVDSPPSFIDGAVPDTLVVMEDIKDPVLYLPDIVDDPDEPFSTLAWDITTGGNVTATTAADSLYLLGNPDYNGPDNLTMIVTDSFDVADTLSVPVRVLPVNDAPVIEDIPDQTITRGSSRTLDVTDYAVDVDNDPLVVTWSTVENLDITNNGGILTIRGAPEFLGSEDLTVTVTDPGGLEASDSFTVTVAPAAIPPRWTKLPKIGFAQGGADSSLVIWDYVTDDDDPDSNLNFVFTNTDDVDSVYVNTTTGRTTFYDLNNLPGWDRLTVTAYDPDGNNATAQFLVFVGPSDGTPIVGGVPDTTIVAGTQSSWIDLDDYYYDIDNTDNEMVWTWGRAAGADSAATLTIDAQTHTVLLRSIAEDRAGTDRIFFTVTDPTNKFGDDICSITVLDDLSKPSLDLPAKVGFVAGDSYTIDMDDYVADSLYEKDQLTWSWAGNSNAVLTYGTSTEAMTKPLVFSGSASWTGYERVDFSVVNPLGGSAADTVRVFSVPDDGTPVAGGLEGISLRAGDCVSINLNDYYWDADTPDFSMSWSVTGNDSITVSIDPLTHTATVCAPSETWEGTETLEFTVSDNDGNSSTMFVPAVVSGAVLKNVVDTMIFRNPMQEDYMDLYVESRISLSSMPVVDVLLAQDSTRVNLETVSQNYYYGTYLLPLDASIGTVGTGNVIVRGSSSEGKTVQDTTRFGYGRIGEGGGKIALEGVELTVPEGVLRKPALVTIVQGTEQTVAKTAGSEIRFSPDTYTVGPGTLADGGICGFSFAVSDGGAAIFRKTTDGWRYVPAETGDGRIQADMVSGGTYRLGWDETGPVVERVEDPDEGVGVRIADYGTGVDRESIRILIDGRNIAFRFDTDASTAFIDAEMLADAQEPVVTVIAADHTGNTTEKAVVLDAAVLPGLMTVEQNMPNPFNPSTTIQFSLTSDRRVSLVIYDMLGRKVRELADRRFPAGTHSFVWHAEDDAGRQVSSGVYFLTVSSGSTRIIKKMLFLE